MIAERVLANQMNSGSILARIAKMGTFCSRKCADLKTWLSYTDEVMTFCTQSRFAAALSLLLVASSSLRGAQAAPPPEPVPAQAPAPEPPSLAETLTGDAKEAYESGKLLYMNQIFDGAFVKFERAYELSKDARLKWNMASCAKAQNKLAVAYRLVGEYQKESEGKLTEKDQKSAESLRAALESVLVQLTVSVREQGAQIFVQDELAGASPLGSIVRVEPGMKKIRVQKEGYQVFEREIEFGKESKKTVNVELSAIVHEGKLIVRAPKDAAIYLDGKPVGAGEWQSVLPSGGHTLRVTAPDMIAYQNEVFIEDNKSRNIDVTLESAKKPVPAWVWIVGGGVLVAAGAGIGGYFLFRPGPKDGTPGTFSQDALVKVTRFGLPALWAR
jgi:PEGA domain